MKKNCVFVILFLFVAGGVWAKGFMIRLNYYFMIGKAMRMERVSTYFDSDRK